MICPIRAFPSFERATCLHNEGSMIWHEEDASSLEAQRKKLAYARELDQQIEMRKAQQRLDQLEAEAQDRAFEPDERSPAKWLIDGGGYASYAHQAQTPITDVDGMRGSMPWLHSEVGTESAGSPWLRNTRVDSNGDQQQLHDGYGVAFQDDASPARLRITDQRDSTDRLRERAQKLEWRRVLDDQVREKARIKRQEEDERRLREEDDANEERAYLREQHLRAARRRYGLQPSSFTQQSPSRDTPFHGANSLPPPPLQTRFADRPEAATSALRQSRVSTTNPYVYYRQTAEQSPTYGATGMTMPPPAPTRERHLSSSSANVNGGSHGNFNTGSIANRSFDQQVRHQPQQNDSMLEEYRALLVEIRREREELRQEREEVRKEKEEMKMDRARLQLENERMASLVNAQRHLNEQQIDMQRLEQQYPSRRPLATPSSVVDQQYQSRRPSATSSSVLDQQYQSRRPSATPSNQYATEYPEPPAPWQGQMRSPQYSPVNQVEWSMRDLSLARPEVRNANYAEPQGMSMEDFMVPRNRPTPNVMDSPRFKRLSAYRPASAELNEPTLDHSLIGESVFVPVESSEMPRITGTASPTRAPKESKMLSSKLRSSRVIKSRGFYPIDDPILAEAALNDPLPVAVKSPSRIQQRKGSGDHHDVDSESRSKRRARTPAKPSAKSPSRAARQTRAPSNAAAAESEQVSASSSASMSKSLFQVQVLV